MAGVVLDDVVALQEAADVPRLLVRDPRAELVRGLPDLVRLVDQGKRARVRAAIAPLGSQLFHDRSNPTPIEGSDPAGTPIPEK